MNDKLLYTLNGVEYIAVISQANELFQLIQLILTISTTIFILIFKIVAWYKKAKQDGKIDKEEIDEVVEILEEGKETLKNDTKKGRNDKTN